MTRSPNNRKKKKEKNLIETGKRKWTLQIIQKYI